MKNISYINAGAGSGKTFTLTAKLAELIADGKTTPSRVILTTFTEMAAEEFRLKARAMLVAKGMHQRAAELDSALIGTVHSVALRYITKYWYLLGVGAGVKPIPEEDTERYIAATLSSAASPEDLHVFASYVEKANIRPLMSSHVDYDFWKEDVKALIEKAETFGVKDFTKSLEASEKLFADMFPGADGDSVGELRRDVMRRIYAIAASWKEEYERYKKEHDLVSFNDMERLFIELLKHPQVKADIASSVDYVFVDEFQDSNPTQVRIFDMLSEIVAKGSFWVGDPKQAIYDFRGCDTALTTAVTGIVEGKAAAKVNGFEYSVLPYSWRSDPCLVDLVNKAFTPVFAPGLSEDKVVLVPKRKSLLPEGTHVSWHWDLEGQMPEGAKRLSYKKEYLFRSIAARVCDMLQGKGDITMVVDKDSDELREIQPKDIAILCRSNTDCDEVSSYLRECGLRVTRDSAADAGSLEVALLLAILNWLITPGDLVEAELSYLMEDATLDEILVDKGAFFKEYLLEKLAPLKERLRGKPVSLIVSTVINELDLENAVYKWETPNARMQALEAVKALAADYENQCLQSSNEATLGGFVSFLSANPVVVPRDIQEGGVNVLTYHSSKGLEWNIVILCSLGSDDLDQKTLLLHSYVGVNESRLTAPTEENVYSEYIIRYIPRFLSTPRSTMPDDVTNALLDQEDYPDVVSRVRGQAARLLYVGATRARDYLITATTKQSGVKWMENLGLAPECDYKSAEGTYHVWGSNSPFTYMKHIGPDCTPMDSRIETYFRLGRAEEITPGIPKYRTPSVDAPTEGEKAAMSFEKAYPVEGETSERITVEGTVKAYDLFGTCIHNILAVYRPGDDAHNLEAARRTIAAFDLSANLPVPSDIARAADRLYCYLEATYGKAVKVYHELPFVQREEATGQTVTGEMDLVWETEKGCVLVDWKNYPGYDDVLDPKSSFYVGKYANQLGCYRDALVKAGKSVLDILVCYPVQGRCVKVVSAK